MDWEKYRKLDFDMLYPSQSRRGNRDAILDLHTRLKAIEEKLHSLDVDKGMIREALVKELEAIAKDLKNEPPI